VRDLKDREVALKRQLAAAQEKLTRHRKRASEKKQQAQSSMEEARRGKQQAEGEATATMKSTMDQENATTKALQQRMLDATREHDAVMSSLKDSFEQLQAQVQAYHYKLEMAMSATPALNVR
jgi:hypothetical protein